MCFHTAFIYGIYIYTTEVIIHAIKKPYLVYFDFGILESYLIHMEMFHREYWINSIWIRPQAYPLISSSGVYFAGVFFKAGNLPSLR